MAYADIKVERRDGVEWIILNRPDIGNAFGENILTELLAALEAATVDADVRAIVFAAEGKNFQAGADLASLQRTSRLKASYVQTQVYGRAQGVARKIFYCPKPTVAAAQGAVLTMGCEFVLSCDFRIITDNTRFQEKWIHLGAIPALGGLKLLPQLVGLAKAKEIVLRGRPVGAQEALQIGLATELVPPEQLWDAAQALAVELAALSPDAYREAKVALHRGLDSPMESEWQTASLVQGMLLTSDDFREKLDKIVEAQKAGALKTKA